MLAAVAEYPPAASPGIMPKVARRSRQRIRLALRSFSGEILFSQGYPPRAGDRYMQKPIKYITNLFYKPLLEKYLSSTRVYVHKGIRLLIPPEVFHPGFFFSTRLLLRFISRHSLQDRSFLELGAGSGLISLMAARKGAKATATDINPIAVEYLEMNRMRNDIPLLVIHSDLFSRIPRQMFDIIVINPPYYSRTPANYTEYAWYCGENGEYFSGLFRGLSDYTHNDSAIWMILCDGSDMKMIGDLAKECGWGLHCAYSKRNLLEKNYIFKIERASFGHKSAFAMQTDEYHQPDKQYKNNPESCIKSYYSTPEALPGNTGYPIPSSRSRPR
jgi:release factor glutamine methyltransferase